MIYDCATAIARGRVRGGKVAVSADFSVGATMGFAVLCGTSAPDAGRAAGGPAGSAAGFAAGSAAGRAPDEGCRIVVTELFSELKFQAADRGALERDFPAIVAAGAAGAADQAGLSLGPCGAAARGGWAAHPAGAHPAGPSGEGNGDGAGAGRDGREGRGAGRIATGPTCRSGAAGPAALNLMVVALFGDRLHYAGAGEGMLIHARRGDVRRLDPPPPAAGPAAALRIPQGGLVMAPGDTLLAVSRRIAPAEERRAQLLVTQGRGRTADEVAMALLDAFVRLSDPAAGETAFCVLKLR